MNCLKVGFKVPLLFSWYRDSKPIGVSREITPLTPDRPCFPIVPDTSKKTHTAAAVITLGHGDGYMMSAKAIGQDWKSKKPALRHCVGAKQYTQLPQSFYSELEKVNHSHKAAYSLTFSDTVENDSESPELQFGTEFVPRKRAKVCAKAKEGSA